MGVGSNGLFVDIYTKTWCIGDADLTIGLWHCTWGNFITPRDIVCLVFQEEAVRDRGQHMHICHLDNRTVARLRRFFAPTLEALANDLVPGSHECDEPLRRLRMMRRSYADAGRTCAGCPSCEYCQR